MKRKKEQTIIPTPDLERELSSIDSFINNASSEIILGGHAFKDIDRYLSEIDNRCSALKRTVLSKTDNKIEQERSRLTTKPNMTSLKKHKDKFSAWKEQQLSKFRKQTLDKVPSIKLEIEDLCDEITDLERQKDLLIAQKYNGEWPSKQFYDYKFGYIGFLWISQLIEWNLSRTALNSYGGFDRAAAAIFALVMGLAFITCTHFYGKALYEQDRISKMAFFITIVILCSTIIGLRIL